MSVDLAATALLASVVGFAAADLLARIRLHAPPVALVRTNVSGRRVPAILGGPLALGALFGLSVVALLAVLGWRPSPVRHVGLADALLVVVMALAGYWDDLKGDERPRGYRGHLRALGRGRLTGGTVKLLAGAVGGAAAAAVVASGWSIVVVAAIVALTANFLNLLDRAPGRAGKVALLIAAPLLLFGSPQWSVASAGLVGALVACLRFDLGERAMLGDAGANPLGAVLGLGVALSLGPVGRAVALALLLAANLASERWSFSALIERTPPLRALDGLGRSPDGESVEGSPGSG